MYLLSFVRTTTGPSPIKEEGWATALSGETSKAYFRRLQTFLDKQYSSKTIFPPRELLFNAFDSCPLGDVKVRLRRSGFCSRFAAQQSSVDFDL